jgi:hypothetical protein
MAVRSPRQLAGCRAKHMARASSDRILLTPVQLLLFATGDIGEFALMAPCGTSGKGRLGDLFPRNGIFH